MLYIEFFEDSLSTDEKIQEVLQYISSVVKLTSKPVIETTDDKSFYVEVDDVHLNGILDFAKDNPPLNFSVENSNLRSWISSDKRKSIEYSFDEPDSIDAQVDVEKENSDSTDSDTSSDSDDDTKDKKDQDDQDDQDDEKLVDASDGSIDILDFHSMKNIVEQKNNTVCKDECYRRICKKTRNTHPFMTKYEKTRLMCIRAQQIVNGAKILVNIPIEKQNDIHYIVSKELEEKKIPLIVRRYLPNGEHEDWKANELSFIS